MATAKKAQGKRIFQWGEKYVDVCISDTLVYHSVLCFGREPMRRCTEATEQWDKGTYLFQTRPNLEVDECK